MGFLINGVPCDTFAHVDNRQVSDTLLFSLSERNERSITSFLYCDGKPFPVSEGLTAQCYIKTDRIKIISLEGNSQIKNKSLIPSALSVKCKGVEYSVPSAITSLPGYGHGAGEGYNNTVDLDRGIYTQRCIVFEPKAVSIYGYSFFDKLTFEIPISRYDEWVKAIETVKCSHGELSFEYYEVMEHEGGTISSGMLRPKLNGGYPTREELQAFIDEQRAMGTPVVICHGIPDPVELDISHLNSGLSIPVNYSDKITFGGGKGEVSMNTLVNCVIGERGEIIVPLPFCDANEHLSCEINVSGINDDNLEFRYKAANFIVAIVE